MGQKFTRHKVFLNEHSLYVVVVFKPKDWSVRQKVESQIFTRQEVTLNQHSLLRVTAQIVVNVTSNPRLPSFPLLNPPNPLILFSKVSSRCDFTWSLPHCSALSCCVSRGYERAVPCCAYMFAAWTYGDHVLYDLKSNVE